jgi:hypothetical protein
MTVTKKRSKSGPTKRSSSTTVPKTIVEQATLSLIDLPEKPKDQLHLREAVEHMLDTILVALSKGYNHDDVAALLSEKGLDITPASLKYYLSRLGKKKSAAQAKPRRVVRKKAADAAEEDEATSTESTKAAKKAPARRTAKAETPAKAPSRRAAAKSKTSAAETSVSPVEAPDTSTPAAETAATPTKRRSTQTKTKAPAKAAAKPKAAPTPSTRSRKKV